jgi:rare lipoprotein A
MLPLVIVLVMMSSCQSVARYHKPEPGSKPIPENTAVKQTATPAKPKQNATRTPKPGVTLPAAGPAAAASKAPAPRYEAEGRASYYAHKFHGRKTSNGEIYNMHKMTAAHRTLPFGTRVKVTNLSNNISVVVRINDRGPFKKERLIDVSLEAAKRLKMIGPGIAKVRIETIN